MFPTFPLPHGPRGRRLLAALALPLLAAASTAVAQTPRMKPGLWEMRSQMQGGSGAMSAQMAQQMAEAQRQLQALPPEQRRQMEEMMKAQGLGGLSVGPQGTSLRICVTPEQAARDELPQAEPGCTQEVQRRGKVWHYRFSCQGNPPMSGEGEYTLTSATAASGQMRLRSVVDGQPQTMNVATTSTWLGADCGAVKPRP